MPDLKTKILIVDDEPLIRTAMTLILTEVGYTVRSAADGFSALLELRSGIPDILVSDLNMPGMSGFELLSVVRRRFPTLHVIAMSGAFSGGGIPSGVAADAFYQKGSSIGSLLRLMQSPAGADRIPAEPAAAPTLIWKRNKGREAPGRQSMTVACPECLRTYSHSFDQALDRFIESDCVHCRSTIRFEVVDAARYATPLPFPRSRRIASPSLHRMEKLIQQQ
jgi:CheY-like chemotaxis protein